MVPLFQRISLSALEKKRKWQRRSQRVSVAAMTSHFPHTHLPICNRIQQRTKTFIWACQTYGSVDLGIMVPSSLIRSLMLNLLLLSTAEKHEWQVEKTRISISGLVFEGKEIHQSKGTYWGYGCLSSAFLSVKLSHLFLKKTKKHINCSNYH